MYSILVTGLNFNCINAIRGCWERNTYQNLSPHEQLCRYQKTDCPLITCSEDACVALLHLKHKNCYSLLKKGENDFHCKLRYSVLVDRFMGQIREGVVYKPKMLHLQNSLFKKRVFIVFNGIQNEGLEVSLLFLGKRSILPTMYQDKKFCILFTTTCGNEFQSLTAYLELNYEDRYIPSNFVFPQEKLLEWLMWGRVEPQPVKHIELTIHFPDN